MATGIAPHRTSLRPAVLSIASSNVDMCVIHYTASQPVSRLWRPVRHLKAASAISAHPRPVVEKSHEHALAHGSGDIACLDPSPHSSQWRSKW
jgi:hypothetical protein